MTTIKDLENRLNWQSKTITIISTTTLIIAISFTMHYMLTPHGIPKNPCEAGLIPWDETPITSKYYHFKIYCNGSLYDEFATNMYASGVKTMGQVRRFCRQWTNNVTYSIDEELIIIYYEKTCPSDKKILVIE